MSDVSNWWEQVSDVLPRHVVLFEHLGPCSTLARCRTCRPDDILLHDIIHHVLEARIFSLEILFLTLELLRPRGHGCMISKRWFVASVVYHEEHDIAAIKVGGTRVIWLLLATEEASTKLEGRMLCMLFSVVMTLHCFETRREHHSKFSAGTPTSCLQYYRPE